MNLFLFGAGYSARAFAAACPDADITGTTRSTDRFGALRRIGIRPLLFDGATLTDEAKAALRQATHLVVSIAPGDAGDAVLLAARAAILDAMPQLEWIGYLSTVGVYGDHGGAWVDENSARRPVSRRSVARVAAEDAWLGLGRERGVPLTILRLSGIYGPGRNTFVNMERGTARRLVKPGQVFNRIHVDDIAGALSLLARTRTGGIFNVTDDEPAPPQDVVAYAAAKMGIAPPPAVDFATAELSPMARSFYGENKRVTNARIKALGYRFRFPDYRTALDHLWDSGKWRGEDETDGRRPILGEA